MLIFLWAAVFVSGAAAQAGRVPIIEAGREAEILALFEPYQLGEELPGGYRLMNVQVDVSSIQIGLVGPEDRRVSLRLTPPELAPDAPEQTESFAIVHESGEEDADAQRAVRALLARVRANDDGHFYRRRALPPDPTLNQAAQREGPWYVDGLALCALALVFFLFVLGRDVARSKRSALIPVLALTALGALLRVAMSPATMMGAWPFSRTSILMRFVWNSPLLASIIERSHGTLYFFDLVTTVNLMFAFFTPAAVYLHAKKLLEDQRVALLAALLVTLLPLHVRFSQSEVAFIPSIALSSYTFVLVHTALKDRSKWVRLAALAFLPLVASAMFVARPLNQIFLPLLLWTALYLSRRAAPLSRRLIVSGLVTVVGILTFVYVTVPLYRGQIVEGASISTVVNGLVTFLSPAKNTLLYPWITPPGVMLLALGGAWTSTHRRGPERDRAVFLMGWLLLFFVAHAYVVPRAIAMQARYHLHLVVPFVMLAAMAMAKLYTRRRAIFWLTFVYVLSIPLLHRGFIEDVAFDDMREYAFVRSAAHDVPVGCTVMEYTGAGDFDADVRFDRAGEVLEDGAERRLYAAVPIGAAVPGGGSELTAAARDLLAEPPECLYYYEGLFCYGRKEPGEPIAGACAEMHRAAHLEEVTRTRFEHRLYDGNLSGGLEGRERAPIVLRLYRVVP